MSQLLLDEILQRVQELSTEERAELRDRLSRDLDHAAPTEEKLDDVSAPLSEAKFEKQLEDSGFATLPRPPAGWDRVPRHPPVEISGEPLSETILKDRR